MHTIGFLGAPEATAEARTMFDEDIAELGYVMNVSRLWAYQPATVTGLFTLLGRVNSADRLSLRQRAPSSSPRARRHSATPTARSTAPAMVRDAITFGRPIEDVA